MHIYCNTPKANEWKTSPGIMIRDGKPSTYHVAICKKNDAGFFNKKTKQAFEVAASSPEELLRACLSKAGYAADVELEGASINTMDAVTNYLLGLEEAGGYMITSLKGPDISYESPNYESAWRAEAHDLREYYLDIWLTLTKDMGKSSDEADSLIEANSRVVQDCFDDGEGPVVAAQRIAGSH